VRWGEALYRAHPDQMSFQLHAYGHGIEPDVNYPWDYGVPQGGRNPTPFGYSSYAHNCLVVDRRNHSQEAANLVIDDYGEHAKVLGLAGDRVTQSDAVQHVDMGRWLVLCKEYLLDVSYIAQMQVPHTFDLSVPTYSTDISIEGARWEDFDVGADIGFGKIDTIHELDEDLDHALKRTLHAAPPVDDPENWWLTEGRRCKLKEPFSVLCKHPDGVHLALHYGGWDECEILTGKAPLSWRPRDGVQTIPGRYSVVINRKSYAANMPGTGVRKNALFIHSEDHCHYFVVHEPYLEADGPQIKGVRRLPLEDRDAQLWDPNGYPMAGGKLYWTTPRVVEVQGEDFTDYFVYIDHFIALRGGEPGRAILETPIFRVDFTGPYVYLRVADGRIVAAQGEISSAELL